MSKLTQDNIRLLLSQHKFKLDSGVRKEDVICIVCKELMTDPYQTYCGCQYCYGCIVVFLSKGDKYCCGQKPECKDEVLELDKNVLGSAVINRKIMRTKIICPNKSCIHSTELSQMEEHLRICPKQSIECPYLPIGCNNEKTTRDQLVNHIHNEALPHTQLLIDLIQNLKNEVRSLKDKLEVNEKLNAKVMARLDKVDTKLDTISMFAIGTTTFTVDKFDARKNAKECIYSPYFHSHVNGYKLRLQVYPGGDSTGTGTHLSAYIVIGVGEYDGLLSWPCKYSFDISLINHQTGNKHTNILVKIDAVTDDAKNSFNKPLNKDNAKSGSSQFVSNEDLQSIAGLVIDDSIVIKCTVHHPNAIHSQ